MAVIILLLVASPGRAEPGQHSIFPDFAAAETPLNGGYTMPGFALCYQFDPIRYLPIGAVFSYQAPVKVNDAGLRYELYSLEGALYVGGRLAFDWMPGKTATGFLGTLRKILMANELQAGPILGVSHYVQQVRDEKIRKATHPFAGVFMSWDVWFLEWFGVRHSVTLHWSLTEIVTGRMSFMRAEFVWGPAFRF